ncbi:Transcription factor [Zancudomyces culisetae]|uniref:Transcription factor n=1 Tax=Zancudomyces culisetae TaxID=1213189 RepID=A0A1R1PWV2_ZANCU|nr:Transcription factor [Zancudomyces culisetae]|eukprot:OMH85475.1 Transcription factor [Zancudomyces culisetae]
METSRVVKPKSKYSPQCTAASEERLSVYGSHIVREQNTVIFGNVKVPVKLGRSSMCDYQFTDGTSYLSRLHAIIFYNASPNKVKYDKKGFYINVIGLNGVKVNGRLLLKNKVHFLKDGDKLDFIGNTIEFREPKKHKSKGKSKMNGRSRFSLVDEFNLDSDLGYELEKELNEDAFAAQEHLAGDYETEQRKHRSYDLANTSSMTLLPTSSHTPYEYQRSDPLLSSVCESADYIEITKPLSGSISPAFLALSLDKGVTSPRLVDDELSSCKISKKRKRAGCGQNVTKKKSKELQAQEICTKVMLCGGIVDMLVEAAIFSGRSSTLTISDMIKYLCKTHGSLGQLVSSTQGLSDCELMPAITEKLGELLLSCKFFGRVERNVLDANDEKAEDQFYYIPHLDDNETRRSTYGPLVKTARRCTLSDKQYYFKPVSLK